MEHVNANAHENANETISVKVCVNAKVYVNANVSKNKYAQLATATKKNKNKIICPNDYTPKPTSSSDVPGKIIQLYEDNSVSLYNYKDVSRQFTFQNIPFDNFKRIFDTFPFFNIVSDNNQFVNMGLAHTWKKCRG